MPKLEVTAALLSVGTELTEGNTQDTHGRFLSDLLRSNGITTRVIEMIPDDRALYVRELTRLADGVDVVIVTGGLGPTSDDLTREVVAEVAGTALRFHDELWREIERRFSGRRLSETNRRQAQLPDGFTAIANPNGTAPAFWGRVARRGNPGGQTLVVALPGPPRELRPIVTDSVLPLLAREVGAASPETLLGTSFLLPESMLEELIAASRVGSVEWGTRFEQFRIAFTLRGGSANEREAMFADLERNVGALRIRHGEVELERLLLSALQQRSLTIAFAESCTGGLASKLVTDVPGSSRSLWGSWVVYSNDAKERMLGVPRTTLEQFGAVSRETVAAMTVGALERSGADVAVAVSGIAGPDGGSAEKPVGTVWVAARSKEGEHAERLFQFGGARDMVRRRSTVAALLLAEGFVRGERVDNDVNWEYI